MELIQAITVLFSAVDSWQAGTVLLFLIFIPPALVLLAIWRIAKAVIALENRIQLKQAEDNERFKDIVALSDSHFSSFVTRYDNNIYLVQNWEKLAGELSTIVHLNTQAITRLVDRIDFSRLQVDVKPKGA